MFWIHLNSQLSNAQFQKWNILAQKCCEITVDVTPYGLGDVHRRCRGRCRFSFHWRLHTKLQQVRIPQTVRCRIPEHFYIYRNFHRFATKHSLCATWCHLTSIETISFHKTPIMLHEFCLLGLIPFLSLHHRYNQRIASLCENKRNWSAGMWCHLCIINWEQQQ